MVKNKPETSRNAPCPRGSGKKYKRCRVDVSGRKPPGGKFLHGGYWLYIALVTVFCLSLSLRYYGFRQPHGLTFDEGLYAELLANQLKENPTDYSTREAYRTHTARGTRLPEYLDRPLFKHPPLYSYLIALNYRFFGVSHLSAVSVSVVFGSLMVLAVFFLGKVLYDRRVGLLAAFFLSVEPVHWVCSERIWMETTLSFFILLAVLLFVRGQSEKFYLPLSGVSIGLAMLTKYPGLLALFIIVSFVILTDRAWLKQKNFWMLCGPAFLIFSPWVIWNWKVYGSFVEPFVSAHSLRYHTDNALSLLSQHKGALLGFCFLAGLAWWTRAKAKALIDGKTQMISGFNKVSVTVSLFVFLIALLFVPLLGAMAKEALVWKDHVVTGWFNPFSSGPWHFYLTRLPELSPLYLFSYLSAIFIFGKNKGDRLLWLSCLWILGVFILLGNYQSRYILPAVPFLMILSARFQIWVYDRLSMESSASETARFNAFRPVLKIIFTGVVLYFMVKTLRVDGLIAIAPDFGYF
jgi:4-amino-4-deoxy-L-arabinose transferase-like glycosyltransferase